jgi:hypothetical protein
MSVCACVRALCVCVPACGCHGDGLTQAVATMGTVGLTTCIWGGALLDKRGPAVTARVGAVLIAVSMIIIWAIAAGHVDATSHPEIVLGSARARARPRALFRK